jgi:NADH-quinone oxidoreductase subunit J
MIVSILFYVFAALAVVGAIGLLVLQRAVHCGYCFLLCCVALVGLCLLLNLGFLALVQLLITLAVTGLLATGTSIRHSKQPAGRRRMLIWLLVAVLLMSIIAWAIVQGRIGEPIHQSVPMWAVYGERVAAFGQELLDNHLVLLELVGLFLLASAVSITHLIRQSRKTASSDEFGR